MRFFYCGSHTVCPVLFLQEHGNCPNMKLTLIKNPDTSKSLMYKIARIVYAETHASSLRVVEALTSMIANFSRAFECPIENMVCDASIFPSLCPTSSNHELLNIDITNSGFEMCLRTVGRMLHGNLPDTCFGATRFHHADTIPDWATSRGYIADIDGLLFYL